jgi:hypothetical protein
MSKHQVIKRPTCHYDDTSMERYQLENFVDNGKCQTNFAHIFRNENLREYENFYENEIFGIFVVFDEIFPFLRNKKL